MNTFDNEIIYFISQFSQISRTVDLAVGLLARNNFFKGGVLVAILWWIWFRHNNSASIERKYVISTIFSCIIAIVISKVFTTILKFRLRPMHEYELGPYFPSNVLPNYLDNASSIPSDHAVVFFSLSIGLLFISRKIGIFAILYTFILIAFPRMYLGLHYPSDILFGAIIAICTVCACNIFILRTSVTQLILDWSNTNSACFYLLFFIISFELANLFENSRPILFFIYRLFN